MPPATRQSVLPETKQLRSELSTRRLIEAASALIAEQGYDRTTLAAIGRRAGYSHGLVTQRFGSKEGLLAALVEYITGKWDTRAAGSTVDGAGGPEVLVANIDWVRANIREAPDMMRGLYALIFEAYKPIPTLHDLMSTRHEDVRKQIERDVRRGVSSGTMRKVEPRAYARYFLAVLRGFEFQWLLEPDSFDIDKSLAWFADHVRETLTPPSHGRRRGRSIN
jgi:AcrR family transcriptional regulator